MELTLTYVLSQVFVIISAILLMATYQLKTRKAILIVCFISLLTSGASYILLSAWSGLAMIFVAMVRNIIFMVDEKKNNKKNKVTTKDIIVLLVLYAISIISAIYTYEGFFSLMSVFATMLYTYSVWQKKTSVYKILGIFVEILWIIYNIYILSILGIILEMVLAISAAIGVIREYKSKKKRDKKI